MGSYPPLTGHYWWCKEPSFPAAWRTAESTLERTVGTALADRIYVGAEPQFNTLRVVAMRPLDETFANERAKRSAPLSVRLHLLDMGVATFAIEHCVEGTSGRAEKLGDLIVSLRTIGRDAGNCVDPLLWKARKHGAEGSVVARACGRRAGC